MTGKGVMRVYSLVIKNSKLDWFLAFKAVVDRFQGLQEATLNRKLSDHYPIFRHDLKVDYGPTSFNLFNSWLIMDGFDDLVCGCATDKFVLLKNKIKLLKNKIWDSHFRAKEACKAKKVQLESRLADIDSSIDGGLSSIDLVNERKSIIRELGSLKKVDAADLAQKPKVQWLVKGDENSAFFHGMLKNKRWQALIRGVSVGGEWVSDPVFVKN
uniref:RNA-directed DNA polymerase, eukaryota, reverse transcriptase zinc-binding domain protein n=1 Tax=Lactuca sativa TaxID=4236 RepID=A0A9R1WWF4_LACSA|nr:hypothetical protein LSAT_V11C800425010 [Lactuca sativa]